jgi:peptidoglycan hydrolase CwlO-like protein
MSNTQLNMSQAAQAAGITRRTLYNHVKQGKVTTSRDEKNNPVVDVSELIRAYGNVSLPVKKIPTVTQRENTQGNFPSEQLQAMQKEIEELKLAVTHMLEDKTARESERKQHEEERRKYQEEISTLNEKLERERKKGFWARLRG